MTNTRNHGGKRTGAGTKTKPQGEAKQWFTLGIPEKDIKAYGGLKKLKTDFQKWFYKNLHR
jgi:hypothetical protein